MRGRERGLSAAAAALAAVAVLLWLAHFALRGNAPWLKYVWTAVLAVGVAFYLASLVAVAARKIHRRA
jgi:hypothetical protein